MQYGLSLPNGGVCGDVWLLAELGCLAETTGWDRLFVEDYIVHQSDGAFPTSDPWIALAAIAVGTKQIRLGTSVTPLSRKVAREAVALDQLSHGRFMLGVGSGDGGEAGFSRVNEARDAKERTSEDSGRGARYHREVVERRAIQLPGAVFSGAGNDFIPTPVQKPRIPILVGDGLFV